MKNLFLTTVVSLLLTISIFGHTTPKTINAIEIIKQITDGRSVNYENVTVTGDFDLSRLTARKNDAIYPENGKTVRVYTAYINQSVTFKNVVFRGKVDFFRKEVNPQEIAEFRLAFSKLLKFDNCTFEQNADFELTNFDGGISFENSTFKTKPSFIRIGLQNVPNFSNTVFEQGSIFKNFQNDSEQNLTAANLAIFYRNYLAKNR